MVMHVHFQDILRSLRFPLFKTEFLEPLKKEARDGPSGAVSGGARGWRD
jgi:hypothetical protein